MSSLKLFLLFLVIFSSATLVSGISQQCDGMRIEYNALTSFLNITLSANLKVVRQNNTNMVTMTDIVGFANYRNSSNIPTIVEICALITPMVCFRNFSQTYSFGAADRSLQFRADVIYNSTGHGYRVIFGQSVLNEASFAFYEGQLFDTNHQCFSVYVQETTWFHNATQCCTSFKNTSTPTNVPPCKRFQSTSTIYDDISDNTTWAQAVYDYDLTQNNLFMLGNFMGPSDWFPILVINDLVACTEIINQTVECGYPIGNYGNVLISYIRDNRQRREVVANRLILRDGQTLMSEGVPFTTANPCQEYKFPFGSPNFPLLTQFCCTEFLPDTTTTSTPTTTTVATSAIIPNTTFSITPITATIPTSTIAQNTTITPNATTTTTSAADSFYKFAIIHFILLFSLKHFY